MDYIKIIFDELQPEQKEILIAQLADAGYEGFEEAEKSLFAFIGKNEFDKYLLDEISFKYQTPYRSEAIPETNWNNLWESNFEPVIVENIVAIRAGFHDPIPGTRSEIIITPKMSFGTGHHATTYLMIRLMDQIDLTEKVVFDFGTGTGILAIFAEKKGAKEILAIDNDEWSIQNAEENFQSNNCKNIILKKASCLRSDQDFDIILANINKNVILENFSVLKERLKRGGVLLLSGLLEIDREDIVAAAKALNLTVNKEVSRNGWIAIHLCKLP